eukprot:118725-Rhodomonas_salina.1
MLGSAPRASSICRAARKVGCGEERREGEGKEARESLHSHPSRKTLRTAHAHRKLCVRAQHLPGILLAVQFRRPSALPSPRTCPTCSQASRHPTAPSTAR